MTHHHHHGMNGCEWCDGHHGLWGAFVLGLGVFAVGTILILNNFGVIDAGGLLPYWPALLVVLGLSHLVQSRSGKLVWGLSWMTIGAIMLLDNLGLIAFGIGELWPMLLLILGANLLYSGLRRRRRVAAAVSDRYRNRRTDEEAS
jgi:hypothetical protein